MSGWKAEGKRQEHIASEGSRQTLDQPALLH